MATIRLNRPEAMNSLDIATKELLRDAVQEAAADPAARCVVLTGTGRAFCTGQDLKEHIQLLESGSSDELFTTVERHYNPTVLALVDGEARHRGGQRRRGGRRRLARLRLRPAGGGGHRGLQPRLRQRRAVLRHRLELDLQRLVGPAKALELLYFPRTVKADEALALGLATQVVPADDLDATVAELAARLAAGPTVALGSIRRSVAYAARAHVRGVARARGRDDDRTGATADHRAAVAAFVAKEKPVFHGPLTRRWPPVATGQRPPNQPKRSEDSSTCSAWSRRMSRFGGCAPYSTSRATLEVVVQPAGHGAWQTPPQSRLLAGSSSVRATRREARRFFSVSTPCSGWSKRARNRVDLPRNASLPCLGLRARMAPDS